MTDQERKAMEIALEALESAANNEGNFHDYKYAANALRQALAQPEQEPVCTKVEGNQFETFKVRYEDAVKLKDLPVGTKLYTAPPSKPEIVGYADKHDIEREGHDFWVSREPGKDTVPIYKGL